MMKVNKLVYKKDLEDIFIALNEQIYRYVYIRTGFNKEIAEDITQDVFMKVWRNKDKFDNSKSSLKNWVYIITRNTITDHYRTSKSEVSFDDEEEERLSDNTTITSEKSLLLDSILNALKRLKNEDKEIIILRYIEELEVKEISKIINKNYIATKVMVHRAIGKLKNIIEEKHG